ncbi:MAG: hypothetical protein KTR17_00945 [Cellvibrionaceae bacterium]|nr:hypothetical protein [Cellvibrionaceae bacterium]
MAKQHSQKYLATYAEPEVQSLAQIQECFARDAFRASLAIPAYNEQPNYLKRWMLHPQAQHYLLITVVNAPDTQRTSSADNIQLWQFIESQFHRVCRADNVSVFEQGPIKLLAVDRFSNASQRLPKRQGVGLARKIACDLSVFLYCSGRQQFPWVFSSDADTHLPENYFSAIHNSDRRKHSCTNKLNTKVSALVFNFEHIQAGACDEVFAATQSYQQAIKYYCQQLRYARSPYAFYTLGSALAINIHAYAAVRGFPKRPGGEDFYLLNKLAKIGAVQHCPAVKLAIEARTSQRVPFGTGPAVQKIVEQSSQAIDYRYYSPHIFQELKHWLALSTQLWQYRDSPASIPWPSVRCQQSLGRLPFSRFLLHATRQCKTETVFNKAFHDWFDSFMTLKFIHDMQDHYYPAQDLQYCLRIADGRQTDSAP